MQVGERISVVSQFGTGPESGHSLDDDEFYFDYLVHRGYDFLFHAPRYSLARLSRSYPEQRHRLRELPAAKADWDSSVRLARRIDAPGRQRVIFFGFSERLVLAFLALRPGRGNPLTLVATNNFSARRARLYGTRLRMFLLLVRPMLRSLVVHTEFEKRLVLRLSYPFGTPVAIKKHHLMIGEPGRAQISLGDARLSVAFFGPTKPEKPIGPVLSMIRADTSEEFDYRLYGLAHEEYLKIQAAFPGRNGLRLTTQMLPRQRYIREFAESSLVVLTHTRDFEGKLSGNLCDCIALGVPYVGDAIEPYLEYERRYGPIGSLQNLADDGWADSFLRKFQRTEMAAWKRNLAAAATDFTKESIWASLDSVL